MKIISIDPSADGVTGIIIADYDENIVDGEALTLTNFANVDFRPKSTNGYIAKELRHRKTKELLQFIEEQQPDLVIIENFIMFKQQIGRFGQAFATSELIGVIEYHCRELKIPVIKPRSSDVRKRSEGFYESEDEDGNIKRVPKPRKFKDGLTTKDLKERGLLVAKRYNRTHLKVGEELYSLKDYQVGSKNDHILMALRHLINVMELSKISWETKVENIEKAREVEDDFEE